MRKLLLFATFVLMCFAWGCGSGSSSKQNGSESNPESENQENESSQSSTASKRLSKDESTGILEGHWMLDDYLTIVGESKSVLKAQEESSDIIEVGLMKDQLLSENPLMSGASSHEGGYIAHLEWNDSVGAFRTKDGGLGYIAEKPFILQILSDDLIAFKFDEGSLRKFRRTNLPATINDMLFTGSYRLADGTPVTFTSEGKIEDHPKFAGFEYEVLTDFFEIRMDRIRFRSPEGEYQEFNFVFDEEGFNLYEIFGSMGEGFSRGDLVNKFNAVGGSKKEGGSSKGLKSEVNTHYHDLPKALESELKQVLKTEDFSSLDEQSLEVMSSYLRRNVLSDSQFGPFVSSNYFWYVYNALPDFVEAKERHQGYYRGQNEQSMGEKLKAYAIYRIDRSPENIQRLFLYVKPMLKKIVPPSTYTHAQIDRKVAALLASYNRITEIDGYQDRLSDAWMVADTTTGEFVDVDGHKEFRKYDNSAYGLYVYELNELIMKHLDPDADRYTSMPEGLSFWMRRNHEGNMDEVHAILKEINEMY
jgi:hypothetical protein